VHLVTVHLVTGHLVTGHLVTGHLAGMHLAALHLVAGGRPVLARPAGLPGAPGLVARWLVLADPRHRAGLLERPDAAQGPGRLVLPGAWQGAGLLVLPGALARVPAALAELAGVLERAARARPERARGADPAGIREICRPLVVGGTTHRASRLRPS
jgi:hypothetical protein